VPIPTYYGDEICYVNGLAYGWNVIKTVLRYKLHKMGLLYASQFDLRRGEKYALKRDRFSSHSQILKQVAESSEGRSLDILDIGCGAGLLASRIAALGHRVVGIDIYDNEQARKNCAEFHVADVEKGFPLEPSDRFDLILFSDVLEHARNPEYVLLRARSHLKANGRIIASSGNVANLYVRLNMLLGRFTYTERGILDKTHCRLFTRGNFIEIVEQCGFRVVKRRATPVPFEFVFGEGMFSRAMSFVNMLGACVWPSLFAYQIILEATLDSNATELLRHVQIHDAEYIEHHPGEAELLFGQSLRVRQDLGAFDNNALAVGTPTRARPQDTSTDQTRRTRRGAR